MRSPWLLPVLSTVAWLWTAQAEGQGRQPFTWWRDAQFRQELALSAEQANRIDGVFQDALPRLRNRKAELDIQEAELSRMIESEAEEASIGRQSEHVEAIRGDLNKARTLMLVHMRQVLTPEQRARFKILQDRRGQSGHTHGSGARRDNAK